MSDLTKRAVIGLVQFIVGLGLLLFVPAWALDYWQAWVYLLLFAVSATLTTAYLRKTDPRLLERRLTVGSRAETQKSQKRIQVYAALAFVGTVALPSIDHRFAWSAAPLPVVLAGDILLVLGFFVIFLVFRENSFAAAIIEVVSDQKVISTGPYAVVRHPMYAGALVMFVGTPLALGSWWGLLMLVPFALTIVWRLLDEERFLAARLPGYNAYCRKVRWRLVPLLW
jgi:protein-S-isoprenylcysteine O-methyltransferase Ste14